MRIRWTAAEARVSEPVTFSDPVVVDARGAMIDGIRRGRYAIGRDQSRFDRLEVVPGTRELANVSAAGLEIVDPSTGDVTLTPLPDLGKLDSIGQRIPNLVPADVGLRLALGYLDELVAPS